MRFLMLASLASCGHGSHHSAPDAPVDAGPTNHLAIRGACAFPLGPSGELVFPDTAASAQTSYRPIDVLNEGPATLILAEIQWSFEGGDAADFAISKTDGMNLDSCFLLGIMFSPTIAAGRSCRLDVNFNPTTPGQKQTMLHVTDGAELDQMFMVRGNAVMPPTAVYASTPDLYVRPQLGGSFMIINAGTSTVDMGQPIVPAPFIAPSPWTCPSQLTPGGACSVYLTLGPATNGGCPIESFTTSTGAITVPLTARGMPSNLMVTSSPYGSVRIDPPGQICTSAGGATCQATYDVPTAVTLTATPDTGGHFLSWYPEPSACGTYPICDLGGGFANIQASAQFASAQAKAIAITINGTGTVDAGAQGSCTTSCTLYAEPGSYVTLSEATSGTFTGWTGDCTGTQSSCNLGNVINDRAVTATFSP